MPSEETFAEIKERMARHRAKCLVWKGEATPELAARFEEEAASLAANAGSFEHLKVWMRCGCKR
jgi:hypothetical protein